MRKTTVEMTAVFLYSATMVFAQAAAPIPDDPAVYEAGKAGAAALARWHDAKFGLFLHWGVYLAQVKAALNEAPLSKETYGKGTPHVMPDQGYAPVAALMLGNLTHTSDRRVLPLLSKLAGRIDLDEDELRSKWGYLFALACGFERLACPEGVTPLRRVLRGGILKDRIVTRADDLRRTVDYVGERYAYLRMALSRARTRCGDPEGALGLCAFLSEARVCFARAARTELVIATGEDFGFDPKRWKVWIQQHRSKLRPNPLMTPFA